MSECWIYRAFYLLPKADEVLLYVGISDSPSDRMAQHARDKWWWHLVHRIEWGKLSSRQVAAAFESEAIAEERPLFNKHQSILSAGAVLCGCLRLLRECFDHCPLCHSACRFSIADWEIKSLCTVEISDDFTTPCFEVRMKCDANHRPVEWTQLIPIEVLSTCHTKMPEGVLSDLWNEADSNGEVCDDIPELRPQTLAEMFALDLRADKSAQKLLVESN